MILDTNALSALADGSEELEDAAARVDVLSLPVIVLGEYRYGIARSRHRTRYITWLAQLVDISHVLPVDDETATRYAALREELRTLGQPIPSNDLWIAALALQHDLPVLTQDAHFVAVPRLRRVSW